VNGHGEEQKGLLVYLFQTPKMNPRQTNSHLAAVWRGALAGILLLLPVCSLVNAQSGRRPPKPREPSPSEAPLTTETDAARLARQEPTGHKIKVLVARQPTSKSLPSEDAIYASFINRLNEFPALTATSLGDLERRQTVKKAKAEKDAFVVLMKFEIDSVQPGTIVVNSPDLKITYFVFAPRTGKERTRDKIYYQAIGGARARKDEWPKGPPLKITPAAAGIAAAVRLHDWLVLVIQAHEKL
jgi:hypothetical protein